MRLTKTETGQQAFKERSPLFTARQRTTFIMFDGNKTVEQVLAATSAMGVTQDDVDAMISNGFLAVVGGAAPSAPTEPMPLSPAAAAAPAASQRSAAERYLEGKTMATKLTSALGLRGFRLNLSVESAAGLDDLIKLLPKIQDAVDAKAGAELERILKG